MKKLLLLFLLFITVQVNALGTSSECAILMDQDSGRILYAKNIDKQKLIASTTKIMTAVIAIESKKLDNTVKVDDSILKAIGSNIYIQVGEEITLRDLVYGLMLRSGNDASLAIANYVSKDETSFVSLMNKKAQELGMTSTIFCNPNGLDNECNNLSTARDMAVLTKYADSLKEYRKIVGTKKYIAKTNYKTYVWTNKNKLLKMYKYTTGGKTGFTEKAKRTLVTTATKDNMNLIVVTLNDPNDWTTHKDLYEYGFNNYTNYLILDKDTFNLKNTYYKHKLYIKNNYYYPLKESEKDYVSLNAKLYKIDNPKNKQKIGVMEVYYKNKKVHEEPIYITIKERKKESIFKRFLELFK